MAPIFAELAKKFTDVMFLKVDVDELKVRERCLLHPYTLRAGVI